MKNQDIAQNEAFIQYCGIEIRKKCEINNLEYLNLSQEEVNKLKNKLEKSLRKKAVLKKHMK